MGTVLDLSFFNKYVVGVIDDHRQVLDAVLTGAGLSLEDMRKVADIMDGLRSEIDENKCSTEIA